MSNDSGEYMVSRVVPADTGTEQLENKVRVMLDELKAQLQMPWGMTLEGVITNDRFGNKSLYVFLKKDDQLFPGRDLRWNDSPDQIEEAVGGKWISLNDRGLNSWGAEWEARDLKKAVEHFKLGLLTKEAVREHYRSKEQAEYQARLAQIKKEQEA